MVHRAPDSRLLGNLLVQEKEYQKQFLSLLDHSQSSIACFSAYASASSPPTSQVILTVAASFAGADEALRRYARSLEEWRDLLKKLKEAEDEVGTIIRDREILVTRLIKASKSKKSNRDSLLLSEPYPSSSSLSLKSDFSGALNTSSKLAAAQSELQACEAHLAAKERELDLLRTSTVKEGLSLRCKAMVECGWVWGEMGKDALRVLDSTTSSTEPSSDRTTSPDLARPSSDLSSLSPSQSASQIHGPPPTIPDTSHIYSDANYLDFPSQTSHSSHTNNHRIQIPPAHSIAEIGLPTAVPSDTRPLSTTPTPGQNQNLFRYPSPSNTNTSIAKKHILSRRITEEDLNHGHADDLSSDEEDNAQGRELQVVENPRFGSLSKSTGGSPGVVSAAAAAAPVSGATSSSHDVTNPKNRSTTSVNKRFSFRPSTTLGPSLSELSLGGAGPMTNKRERRASAGFFGSLRGLFGGKGAQRNGNAHGDGGYASSSDREYIAPTGSSGSMFGKRNSGSTARRGSSKWETRTDRNLRGLGKGRDSDDERGPAAYGGGGGDMRSFSVDGYAAAPGITSMSTGVGAVAPLITGRPGMGPRKRSRVMSEAEGVSELGARGGAGGAPGVSTRRLKKDRTPGSKKKRRSASLPPESSVVPVIDGEPGVRSGTNPAAQSQEQQHDDEVGSGGPDREHGVRRAEEWVGQQQATEEGETSAVGTNPGGDDREKAAPPLVRSPSSGSTARRRASLDSSGHNTAPPPVPVGAGHRRAASVDLGVTTGSAVGSALGSGSGLGTGQGKVKVRPKTKTQANGKQSISTTPAGPTPKTKGAESAQTNVNTRTYTPAAGQPLSLMSIVEGVTRANKEGWANTTTAIPTIPSSSSTKPVVTGSGFVSVAGGSELSGIGIGVGKRMEVPRAPPRIGVGKDEVNVAFMGLGLGVPPTASSISFAPAATGTAAAPGKHVVAGGGGGFEVPKAPGSLFDVGSSTKADREREYGHVSKGGLSSTQPQPQTHTQTSSQTQAQTPTPTQTHTQGLTHKTSASRPAKSPLRSALRNASSSRSPSPGHAVSSSISSVSGPEVPPVPPLPAAYVRNGYPYATTGFSANANVNANANSHVNENGDETMGGNGKGKSKGKGKAKAGDDSTDTNTATDDDDDDDASVSSYETVHEAFGGEDGSGSPVRTAPSESIVIAKPVVAPSLPVGKASGYAFAAAPIAPAVPAKVSSVPNGKYQRLQLRTNGRGVPGTAAGAATGESEVSTTSTSVSGAGAGGSRHANGASVGVGGVGVGGVPQDGGEGAPKRMKSVRVSLQPTFSPSPPAIEDDEEEDGEGEEEDGDGQGRRTRREIPPWGRRDRQQQHHHQQGGVTTSTSTSSGGKKAQGRGRREEVKDMWEDSSEEEEGYKNAKRLLMRAARKEKAGYGR